MTRGQRKSVTGGQDPHGREEGLAGRRAEGLSSLGDGRKTTTR